MAQRKRNKTYGKESTVHAASNNKSCIFFLTILFIFPFSVAYPHITCTQSNGLRLNLER
jgi:hypothetical protein